jgi:hypothetical protein
VVSELAIGQKQPRDSRTRQKKDAIRCRNYTCHASKPRYQVSKLYIRCSLYCSVTGNCYLCYQLIEHPKPSLHLALSEIPSGQTSPRWLGALKRRLGAVVAWLNRQVGHFPLYLELRDSDQISKSCLFLPRMASTKVKHTDHDNVEQDVAVGSTYIPDLNDKAMERRVVRKIDTWILPFICISYLINYLDRVSPDPHVQSLSA